MRTLSRLLALLVWAVWGGPARSQDITDAFLEGPVRTFESRRQDDRLRGQQVEMQWLLARELHPNKRVYFNLERSSRRVFRQHLYQLIVGHWTRGAANDLLLAWRGISEYLGMTGKFRRDLLGQSPCDEQFQVESDEEEVKQELERLVKDLSKSSGQRLTPPTYSDQLGTQEGYKSAHVGLGQQVVGFASSDESVVRKRLDRFFRWGSYDLTGIWPVKQGNLKSSCKT